MFFFFLGFYFERVQSKGHVLGDPVADFIFATLQRYKGNGVYFFQYTGDNSERGWKE